MSKVYCFVCGEPHYFDGVLKASTELIKMKAERDELARKLEELREGMRIAAEWHCLQTMGHWSNAPFWDSIMALLGQPK